MGAILYIVLGLFTGLKDMLKGAGKLIAAKPSRIAIAVLLAVCAFLAWRLSSVDGDRDDWRAKVEQHEAAAKALAEANVKASEIGVTVAAETKGTIDASNEAARAAARDSDDPLRAAAERLRAENRDRGDKAPAGTADVR